MCRFLIIAAIALLLGGDSVAQTALQPGSNYDPTAVILEQVAKMDVGPLDWPQWGGSSHRNNTPYGENIPTSWDIETGENVLWSAPVGGTYSPFGALAVANGRLYIGSNNREGYVARFPPEQDRGCLICFDAMTGEFLWQHTSSKLSRVHDWPENGVCSVPYCEGDRLWYVTNRGVICCLDAEGFTDEENDGPFVDEGTQAGDEADVVWEFDMLKEYGVYPHDRSCCCCAAFGDTLFVTTGNGVDQSHSNIPSPDAPSLIAMNMHTAEVLWTDNSPGLNILHIQWSSPTVAVLGGVPQVLFGGGDGWLYSFTVEGDGEGHAELLWKFDCNLKESKYVLGGRGTRSPIVACPVVYDGLVYCAVGDDPEHGEGTGRLWCINPTRRGDVSPELTVDAAGNALPPRRLQAVIPENGERAITNPNSAVVWHHSSAVGNADGRIDWEEQMHRTMGTAVIKDDLLFIADFSGLLHCLNARTGLAYWSYDLYAAAWGSPMIVDGKVYVCDEEGDVAIFEVSREMNLLAEIYMENTVYTTPVVANNILYICNKEAIFAIAQE